MSPIQSLGPMDLFHADPFHLNGIDYIAMKCAFTGWLFCFKLESLKTEHIIPTFETVIEFFGKPGKLITDNATCFTSGKFEAWKARRKIKHETSSPGHAAGNGNSENAVRECKQMLRKLKSNWQAFKTALSEYNSTPRANDGISPAELMFGRKLRGELPALDMHFNFHLSLKQLFSGQDNYNI